MNSRWQANKIGLINFWYYDDQEFPFVKGRMLLRGSNGSGKSVTMQSVIPLLLDGNMSPERLDPFGSRDRKMSSYLLEEGDGREERTGYLYLEFRRQESETYLTIGMGIRARRGKPLDKWYFSLTDGRRIGKDFFLYKEMDGKVPLSQKELSYRIQGGGSVFDRQSDYMEYVNRQIFGFETVEEYKEMVDLLIQLRTPKLSRDFKPSVVNDILSDSLQPLSEEDLRPMSEAIENMDTMNMNLKDRLEAKQAAEKIHRVLDKYNRLELLKKAENLEENQKMLSALKKEESMKKQIIQNSEKRVEELKKQYNMLDAQKGAMEKERESLSKSDAVALKEREGRLRMEAEDKEHTLKEKETQLEGKKEQYFEIEGRQKSAQDREYEKERELIELLEEMQCEADDMAFEEHGFMSMELKNAFQKPFSFHTHSMQFKETQQKIQQGLSILKDVDIRQSQMEELLAKRAKQQREIDGAQRRVNEAESIMVQVQNEWKEKLYRWNGENQELVLETQSMKELARFVENYNEKADFSIVRQVVADVRIDKKEMMESQLRKNQEQEAGLKAEYSALQNELEAWENHREPEPDRSEAVIENRKHLRKMNIPYQEFYKVIEFGQSLDKTACDRLEEALLQMGILDALVVDEMYKSQVLSMEKGCSDRYLFVKDHRAERSILDVLDLNDSVNDIFFNQRITGILSNIAYDGEGITSVSADGTYQLGILTGTVTGEYEAGFLGTQAREKNRLQKIQICKEKMAKLKTETNSIEKIIEETELRMKKLSLEYERFPGDEDLREALRMLQTIERELQRLQEDGVHLDGQIKEAGEILKELKKKALKISEKLYLSCTYETFARADEAARDYGQHFYQLRSGHELYLQLVEHGRELTERLEDLDADMDQIRYDSFKTQKILDNLRIELKSVEEQLKLTDYEEIKERLDRCIRWLNEYPTQLQKCVKETTENEQNILHYKEQLKQNEEKIKEYAVRNEYLKRCYDAECALGYVILPNIDRADVGRVRAFLEIDNGSLQKEAVIRDLNRIYFENRGYLNEYQLTQTELFEELDRWKRNDEPSAKRLDIYARYQGVRISFGKLLSYLEEEIKELQELIKAGDRELFEDILANTMSRKIRGKINSSNAWVDKMNTLMGAMNTSNGLKLSLRWRSKTAEHEDQLDTRELVNLLKKDYRLMREEEAAMLSRHFRSKVDEARRHAKNSGGMISFYQVMKETLDYRKWFEFQLFYQKSGERQKELTNSAFGTFSGGEKAMSMYVPLFSAVVAKYQGGRQDAPRLISLDEAFAGVDNRNIRDMFRLMAELEFDFIINSQVLWGDCDTLDALAIYQLIRPENAKFVTVMSYLWNGKAKEMLDSEYKLEQRAAEFA